MKAIFDYSTNYWMGHHKQCNDVMLFSAHKNRDETIKLMEEAYGEDWFMDENFEIILVEIRKVM